MLARYGPAVLWVHTQAQAQRPHRPRLRFGPLGDEAEAEEPVDIRYLWDTHRTADEVVGERWDDARYLWDARATDGLRRRLGGDDRTAFHHRDGRRLTTDELPTGHPGHDDPAALVEWTTLLLDAGRYREAWVAAGIGADLLVRAEEYPHVAQPLLPERNASVAALAAEVRHRREVSALVKVRSWAEAVFIQRSTAIVAVGRDFLHSATRVPRVAWQRFPDLELLRWGRIAPSALHPLVRTALFPDLADTGYHPAAEVAPPDAVRVRCRGAWHRIGWRDGRVDTVDHPPGEARRERTLRALGGAMSPCFTVTDAWLGGDAASAWTRTGRLPRALRTLRRDAVALIEHGDTDAFVALLDRGLDPAGVRTRRHRTPLHLVAHLDAPGVDVTALVRRLLDAGLDIDADDSFGRTPLGTVLFDGGSAGLVRTLLDAGADPGCLDHQGCSPLHLLRSPDAATILPWLRDAGLDLEARDQYGQTPLMVQASSLAPPEVLRAMLAAGAEPFVEADLIDDTIGDKLHRYRYDDVSFVPRVEESADG
ncbi:hypothetical protein GCM10009558_106380 [Virgisporangium aurantiacum]